MAETLGSLCDKLTIVKLKQWHTEDESRRESLALQETQLREEIDEFVGDALAGRIAPARLTYAANKVYNRQRNEVEEVSGTIGEVFSLLAAVNCDLWHEQEKVYEFSNVPAEAKDALVHQLAVLNLKRTQCIDQIDRALHGLVTGSSAAEIEGNTDGSGQSP